MHPGRSKIPKFEDNVLEAGKEGYGALFAVMVHFLFSITSVAVQGLLRAGNKSRYIEFYRKHWCGRGTGNTKLPWA